MPEATYNDYLEQIAHKRRPDWRLVLLGILGSIFAHLFLWVLIPETLLMYEKAADEGYKEFEIMLAPPEEEEIDPNYVPVNPEDFSNPPDETNNFSSENAQAANEELPPELNKDTPFVEGKSEEFQHLNEGGPMTVVSTEVTPQEEKAEQQTQDVSNQQEKEVKQLRLDQPASTDNQTPDRIRPDAFVDEASDNPGLLSMPEVPEVPEDEDKTEFLESETEGEKEGASRIDDEYQKEELASPQNDNPNQNQDSKQAPRQPQPRVNMKVGGPTLLSRVGVDRVAPQANYSAEFSEFGVYLAQMFETIGIEWYKLIQQNRLAERRSKVVIEYQINQYGEVVDVVVLETTSSLQAQVICSAAITNRAPFGDWTQDMRSMLNDPETIRFTFFY